MGFFQRLKAGLSKTTEAFVDRLTSVMGGGRKIDETLYEELEEVLIAGDVGATTALELVDELRQVVRQQRIGEAAELRPILEGLIAERLGQGVAPLTFAREGPTVILVVGVNGVGKTTTIGKVAHYLKSELGKTVLLGAADTFRAAAVEQLEIWGERVGVPVVKHGQGADPAAVAFDAVKAAKARGTDVVLIDTAGRLHNKAHLMEELSKIKRVISRELPGAPHEVLLVLDATTGQNAVSQTKLFKEAADVTAIALTKLDGTAKGGVILAIQRAEGLPVKFIGVGEGVADLRPFDPAQFAAALFESEG